MPLFLETQPLYFNIHSFVQTYFIYAFIPFPLSWCLLLTFCTPYPFPSHPTSSVYLSTFPNLPLEVYRLKSAPFLRSWLFFLLIHLFIFSIDSLFHTFISWPASSIHFSITLLLLVFCITISHHLFPNISIILKILLYSKIILYERR